MDEQPDLSHPADAEADEPRPRLNALTAALLIPALALAVLAMLWVGSHVGKTQPTAITAPVPTPGPTPWPLAWPAEDGGTVDPPTAYGVLHVIPPATAPTYTATLNPGAVAPQPGRPDPRQETVQRLTPLDPRTVAAVALRLGALGSPQLQGSMETWPDSSLAYDPTTSTFYWQPDVTTAALPITPRSDNTASGAAQGWLLQRGLIEAPAPVAATQRSNGQQAAFATWRITAPHLAGQSLVTEITMDVSANGRMSNLEMIHPLVAGTSAYPIVDWEKAWAQVQQGLSRDVDAPENGGGPYVLHVDTVLFSARLVQTPGGAYVIPAYGFVDSAAHVTVYWPALAPAEYTLG